GCPKCHISPKDLAVPIEEMLRKDPESVKFRDGLQALKQQMEGCDDWLAERNYLPRRSFMWSLRFGEFHEMHKPDVLHTVHLGLMKDLVRWVGLYNRMYNLEVIFGSIYTHAATRRYPGIFLPDKPIDALPTNQLHGKEYRNF